MNPKIKNKETDYLFNAILSLETLEEAYNFFEDVCTVNEIFALGQRVYVAKCLKENMTYVEIKEKTGASTATISRVNRVLLHGTGALKESINKMK